ncbi:MAG: TldD/PmbA family protein [Candidatus Thermoplasmatota archaeon]|nr:TldD/PmbA family protein [Candidatus Thermoplasmatota archaeon]
MIPDDITENLDNKTREIAKVCKSLNISQWEIIAEQSYGYELDIEAGKITMASGGGAGGFGIRIVNDGKYAYTYVNSLSGIEKALLEAKKICDVSPSIEGFELPSNSNATEVKGMYDKSILSAEPEFLLSQGDDLISHVSSLDSEAKVTGGGIGVGVTASQILSSEGIDQAGLKSSHGLGVQVSIDKDEKITSSWQSYSQSGLIDFIPKEIDEAVHWARVTRNVVEVDKGAVDGKVVMNGGAFTPLFSMVVPSAIAGEKYYNNESLWSGKIGTQVISQELTIMDNPHLEGGKASAGRDAEGVPTNVRSLVSNGILEQVNWSVRDSAKAVQQGLVESASTTGSAQRGGYQSVPFTGNTNMFITSKRGNNSTNELLSKMGDGYIVNSVMGAHTANPTSGDFSVTTSSILKVEEGEVVGALKQAGVSGNMAKALSGIVEFGGDVRPRGSYSSGSVYVSDVLLHEGVRINPA